MSCKVWPWFNADGLALAVCSVGKHELGCSLIHLSNMSWTSYRLQGMPLIFSVLLFLQYDAGTHQGACSLKFYHNIQVHSECSVVDNKHRWCSGEQKVVLSFVPRHSRITFSKSWTRLIRLLCRHSLPPAHAYSQSDLWYWGRSRNRYLSFPYSFHAVLLVIKQGLAPRLLSKEKRTLRISNRVQKSGVVSKGRVRTCWH